MTTHRFLSTLLLVGLGACDGSTSDTTAGGASASAKNAAPFATKRTLPSGTPITVTMRDSMSSRRNTLGNEIEAAVSNDVLDAKGRVAIPAGSPVGLHISAISPSKAGDNNGEGVLELTVTSVTVGGVAHRMNVVVASVPHSMKGRGITKGVAEDVAVGTAIGAVAGQVIGKNTKGTVIGGAAGAVAGGAVAVAGAQRDIVVAPGTRISFALPEALTLSAK